VKMPPKDVSPQADALDLQIQRPGAPAAFDASHGTQHG